MPDKKSSKIANTVIDSLDRYNEKENEKRKNANLKSDLNFYGVSDEHEKELIQKGEYSAWDFTKDENNLSEDDYYKRK